MRSKRQVKLTLSLMSRLLLLLLLINQSIDRLRLSSVNCISCLWVFLVVVRCGPSVCFFAFHSRNKWGISSFLVFSTFIHPTHTHKENKVLRTKVRLLAESIERTRVYLLMRPPVNFCLLNVFSLSLCVLAVTTQHKKASRECTQIPIGDI